MNSNRHGDSSVKTALALAFTMLSPLAIAAQQTTLDGAAASRQATELREGSPSKDSALQEEKPKPAEALLPQQAFEILKKLNDQQKLFPASLEAFMSMRFTSYKGLKPENCSGVVLSDGSHLVGESSGEDYGLNGATIDKDGHRKDKAMIGFLYSEAPFVMRGESFEKASCVLFAFTDELEVSCDSSTLSYHSGFRKQMPKEKVVKVPLSPTIESSLVSEKQKNEKSKRRPRFSLVQEKADTFIALEGNKIAIEVKKP